MDGSLFLWYGYKVECKTVRHDSGIRVVLPGQRTHGDPCTR